MVVEALFLLSIWTKTVHSKESALIREARETKMGFTKIVNHACDSSLSDEDKMTKNRFYVFQRE